MKDTNADNATAEVIVLMIVGPSEGEFPRTEHVKMLRG